MPLSEAAASKIVYALEDAAAAARSKAKREEKRALLHLKSPLFPFFRGCVAECYFTWRLLRLWSVKGATDSIDACVEALEGMVWLAAEEHDRGLELLEGAINYRAKVVSGEDTEDMWNPVVGTLNAVLKEDLPAIRQNRSVNPGFFDRVSLAMAWHSYGDPYTGEMLRVYRQVKDDVAQALEAKDQRVA